MKDAKCSGKLVCIELDANAKLGREIIPGDPKEQSKNGERLMSVIEENDLIVVNSLDLCSGTITRSRETKNSSEVSVLDYFLVCSSFLQLITKMVIDESKIDTLTKYITRNGNVIKAKPSDHNMLRVELEVNWDSERREREERVEMYNFGNRESFKKFVALTTANEELDE